MEMGTIGGENIGIGEDITPPLSPLSFALHDSFLHSHCSSCFSPLLNNTPFAPPFSFFPHHNPPPTHSPLYCSPLCFSFSSHYFSLESFLLHSFASPTSDLRAAIRLLRSLPPSFSPDEGERIFGLLTNREKLMADDEICTRVRDGVRAITAAKRMRDGEELIEMKEKGNKSQSDVVLYEAAICLVLTNAVEVQDKEGHTLGIAVYGPNFSWINHSCSPNACYRFLISPPRKVLSPSVEPRLRLLPSCGQGRKGVCSSFEFTKGYSECGPRVIVRSIKRINKGAEVTVAYTDLLQPKEIRQSELWLKYRFVCRCPRCSASPPSYIDHALQEIYALNMPSWSLSSNHSFHHDEATRKLTDYVDEVITEYLTVGDPESCCKKLERMLILGFTEEGKSQLHFRLHPLHHLALNAYMTLASSYKVQARDLLALHSEVDRPQLEYLNMRRISAAYSLLLAAGTQHLFCFDSSLIQCVANFWTSAGESLLTFARSSAWGSLGKLGLPVSSSSLAKYKCPNCSLLHGFEANLVFGPGQNTDLENISSNFLDCITSLLQNVWGFLIQGCHYLKMSKESIDFSWLGKSCNISDFEVHLVSNHMDTNCCTKEGISRFEMQGYSDQERLNIFLLGVHCLLYAGSLAFTCYGPHSHWINHIKSILYDEGE